MDGETEKEKKEEHKLETDTEGISSKIFSFFLSLSLCQVNIIRYSVLVRQEDYTGMNNKEEEGAFLDISL